jgi:hypothetical protein
MEAFVASTVSYWTFRFGESGRLWCDGVEVQGLSYGVNFVDPEEACLSGAHGQPPPNLWDVIEVSRGGEPWPDGSTDNRVYRVVRLEVDPDFEYAWTATARRLTGRG